MSFLKHLNLKTTSSIKGECNKELIKNFDYSELELRVLADIIRTTGLTKEQIVANPEKACKTYERLKQEARDKVSGTDWI